MPQETSRVSYLPMVLPETPGGGSGTRLLHNSILDPLILSKTHLGNLRGEGGGKESLVGKVGRKEKGIILINNNKVITSNIY